MSPCLEGECAAIDTACSSSMAAVHFSRASLGRGGGAGGAHQASIASGVSLMISPVTMARICQLGALSPTGRCKTLDASADGYGRSEGCVVFVIAPADAGDDLSTMSGELHRYSSAAGGLTHVHSSPLQLKLKLFFCPQPGATCRLLPFYLKRASYVE